MSLQNIGAKRNRLFDRKLRVLILSAICGVTTLADRGLAQAPDSSIIQIEQWSGVNKKSPTASVGSPDLAGSGIVLLPANGPATVTPIATSAHETVTSSSAIGQSAAPLIAPGVNLAPPVQMHSTNSNTPLAIPVNPELFVQTRNETSSSHDFDKASINSLALPGLGLKNHQETTIAVTPEPEPEPKADKAAPVAAADNAEKIGNSPVLPALPFVPDPIPTEQRQMEEQVSIEASGFKMLLLILGLSGGVIVAIFVYFFIRSRSHAKAEVCQTEARYERHLDAVTTSGALNKAAAASACASTIDPVLPESTFLTSTISATAYRQPSQIGPEPYQHEERRRIAQSRRVNEAVWQSLFEEELGRRSKVVTPYG